MKKGHRQVVENSRQYLLGRTDILQNTVVGCPWTVLRLSCYCQTHGFGSPREPHQLPSWIYTKLLLRETLIFFFVLCRGENRSVCLNIWVEDRKLLFSRTNYAFPENSSKLFLFWKSSRTLVNKYALSFRALPLETGQLEWICCLLGAQCRTLYSVMAWFLIPGGGKSLWWPIRWGSTQRGYLFRLQVYERVGILLVEVYERPVEKSVIWVSEMTQRAEQMNFMAL